MRAALAALVAVACSSCLSADVQTCADGTVCPTNFVCSPAGGCVPPGARCGDGVRNGAEDCDGFDLGDADCATAGRYTGTLGCLPTCAFDLSGCTGFCGDGERNGVPGGPLEVCDGADLAGLDCTDLGFYGPDTLHCNAGCFFDTTSCTGGVCGDETIDAPEDCEPSLGVGGLDCTDFGFYVADGLACNAACAFDTDTCREECGDGLVNGPEACDTAPPTGYACTLLGQDAGLLGCATACYETFDRCRMLAVEYEYTGIPDLEAVWGTGRDFVACGAHGCIRTSGGAWAPMPGSPAHLNAVWGVTATDLVVVGDPTPGWGIFHYDGVSWTPMAAPGTPQVLWGLWGSASDDVYAVGESVVLHYDGASWQPIASPPAGSFYSVWGDGAGNVFVAGDAGTVARWNGSGWLDRSIATTARISSIWGRSATDLYAVTDSGGEIYHHDGAAWSLIGAVGGSLDAIGETPGGTLVVVGSGFAVGRMYMQVGSTWQDVPYASGDLRDWFSTRERGYAVGVTNSVVGWSGAAWLETHPPPVTRGYSRALWARAPDDVYLAGFDDLGQALVLHRGGTVWNSVTIGNGTLFDVFGTSASTVVGVGSQGHAVHGSGTSFTEKQTGTTAILYGVWGSGSIFYAVGEGGVTVRFNGGSWQSEVSGTTVDLQAVWGVGSDVFAVGNGGTIRRRIGGVWTAMSSGTTQDLHGIWGPSASDLYAVGAGGTILHFDGTAWTPMTSGTDLLLTEVGGHAGQVFATGGSLALQWVGGRWLPLRLRLDAMTPLDLSSAADFTAFLGDDVADLLAGRIFAAEASETVCDDSWDDDGDGLTDCADGDCAGQVACGGTGACAPIVDVACGGSVSGTTLGGATRYPGYGEGCAPRDEGGPERYYRVRRTTAGAIDLTLTAATDLDLVVAGSAGTACIPDEQCLAAAQTASGSEAVSIAAAADTDYVVIVDGATAAAGDFTLAAACP